MPWWYTTLKSAELLGVAPWELSGDYVPRWLWQEWALIANAADQNVSVYLQWRSKRDSEFYGSLGM